MRISTLLLASSATLAVSAQEQIPFNDRIKGWYAAAQDFAADTQRFVADAAAAAASHIPSADAGASKVAEHNVHHLTLHNWANTLQHSSAAATANAPEPWMVYMTGGNKTCHGRCEPADRAWNESVALLASDSAAPRVAQLDCDAEEILCGAWAVAVPAVWVVLLPASHEAKTPIKIFNLNTTTVTPADFTKIHTRKLYLHESEYQGALHPFDGWVAKTGLATPLAYVLWGFGKIPSWAMMVGISMFSRSFTGKRMPRGAAAPGAPGAPPAAAGGAAAAAK